MICSPTIDFQSRKFKIRQIVANNEYDEIWVKKIQDYCQNNPDYFGIRSTNYNPKNLDILGHHSFEILTDLDDNLVSFCGVYNGGRYPQGVFRLANRAFVTPEYRCQSANFPALTSKLLLPFQLSNLGDKLHFGFISREGLAGEYYLKKWTTAYAPDPHWKVSEKPIHIVPHSTSPTAYQYIAYRNFSNMEWPFKSLDVCDWLRAYSKTLR